MANELGRKLKELRTQRGITLRELGEGVGMSSGYLSQLENGKSSIGINQMAKIADFLDVNMAYFIADQSHKDSTVMKSYEHEIMYIENDLSVEYRISHNVKDKQMLPKMTWLMPGFSTEIAHSHPGEEFIYVIEGVLTFAIDGQQQDLYPGDTAHYSAQSEHKWENNTSKMVKLIAITTPNHFNSK